MTKPIRHDRYFCKKCGELHTHTQFLFGSPVDYDCKKEKEAIP